MNSAVSASAPASVRRIGSPSPLTIRLLMYVPTTKDVPNTLHDDPLAGALLLATMPLISLTQGVER